MNKKEKMDRIYELRKKSPFVAVFLSILITGAGHWYLGKVGKGFVMLGVQVMLWLLMLGWIMWIVAPMSAYYDTKRYNELLVLELK